MFFSRYLYSKVKGSDSKFLNLVLNQDEVQFLKKFGIEFHSNKAPNNYCVNCDNLRELFCN